MKILVSERLSEHKYKTPEGYLICTDAVLARTGKQTYTKDEVFGDGDSTEIDVDRPYEQVMNEKTIASFENKPVTFDHPDEDVNVGNYKSYAVGYVRDVHQGKSDGQDVILGNLVITDQDAIDAIESGEHTDLSCGYECDIKDDGNGHYAQNNIRGNHVALCKEGRAGNARIVDSVNDDMHRYKFEYDVPFYDRKTDESGYEHYTKTLSGISAYDAAKQLPDEAEIIRVYKDGALLKSFTSRKSGEWHKTGNKGQLKGLDTKDMKDETTLDDAKHDFSWFRGYINANLQNYSINSLISNVKSKKQFLHTNLAGNDGNVYIVIIDGSFDADFDKGSDMWIDIILEKPNGQQKRVMTYKFNSWNECQQIFNSFKRRVRDSIDDASLKDEDSETKDNYIADRPEGAFKQVSNALSSYVPAKLVAIGHGWKWKVSATPQGIVADFADNDEKYGNDPADMSRISTDSLKQDLQKYLQSKLQQHYVTVNSASFIKTSHGGIAGVRFRISTKLKHDSKQTTLDDALKILSIVKKISKQ